MLLEVWTKAQLPLDIGKYQKGLFISAYASPSFLAYIFGAWSVVSKHFNVYNYMIRVMESNITERKGTKLGMSFLM